MHTRRNLIAVMLLLSLAACNFPMPTATLPPLPLPTGTQAVVPPATETNLPSTATAEPTIEPTAEPTAIPGTPVDFSGISFRIPQGVGSTISGTVEPAMTDSSLPLFELTPGDIRIQLTDYILQNTLHKPIVLVTPIQAAKALDPIFVQRYGELESTLAAKPAEAESLPFMPIFNAAQVFHTTPVYLDFQNGTGLRYLTQFDQAYMPISNYSLIYTFQGITADGKYHVALVLPVSHASLPADETVVSDYQAFIDNFPTYLQEVKTTLNAAGPDEFTPSLAALDALARSLLVQPVGLSE